MSKKSKEVEVITPENQAVIDKAVAAVEGKEVAVNAQHTGGALAMTGASPELQARIDEVKDNLSTVENFRLPRIKMTGSGAEIIEGEEPLMILQGVILHAKKTNVYYDKPFNPSNVEPPRCFSIDGDRPVADLRDKQGNELTPINPTCKGCPMAEFGTNSMKSGKACRNMKPLFLLLGDEAIIPRQLTVSPTGLKAANQYLMNLTERGLNYRKVRTEMEFYKDNPRDTYCKVKFKMIGKVPEERINDVEYLRKYWLPVMSNQTIDQNEIEVPASAATSGPVDTKGEF